MLSTAEQKLKECYDPYFLVQVCDFFCYCWESSQIFLVFLDRVLELIDLSMAESEEHFV